MKQAKSVVRGKAPKAAVRGVKMTKVLRTRWFPPATPEETDMSRAVLAKVRVGTRLEVRRLRSCAGVAHIVIRRGRRVLAIADGLADIERGTRFGLDTLCRLHGSTKSLVAAAFFTLVEEGTVSLDDPVSKYTQFSDRVAGGRGTQPHPVKVPATLRHLLSMTAGLRYTDCPAYKRVISKVRGGDIASLAAFCDALALIPLQFEPGSQHEYSFCTDFLGRVCEVVSNEDLDAFMTRRLCSPLGMCDTHFSVPSTKLHRCATLYECKPMRGRCHGSYKPVRYRHPDSAPGIMSAGGGILSYMDAGMWGTARDYSRFCQMLLDGGIAADGTRVLRASTIKMLWIDGLAPFAGIDGRLAGWNVDDSEGPPWEGGSWDDCGFSPVSALLHHFRGRAKSPGHPRRGSAMGLGGGGGTYWYVDARRELVAISFTQSFSGGRTVDDGLGPPGNDCVEFAIEAVDAVSKKRQLPR